MTLLYKVKHCSVILFMLATLWVCLGPQAWAAAPQIRRALVLGNDSYPGNRLANARNDAAGMASGLKQLGYITTLLLDGDRASMSHSIERFVDSINAGDAALVYYAGHGFQIDGENYLVPTDFQATDAIDAKIQGYSLSNLLDKVTSHGASTQIVILDACRNNPFGTLRGTQAGWAKTATSAGSFLAFGTSPGSTASDDPANNHGLFTKSVLRFMNDPSLSIEELFQKVRREVVLSSRMAQVPWTASSLVGSFHIAPNGDASASSLDNAQIDIANQGADGPSTRSMSPGLLQDDVQVASNTELLKEAQAEFRAFHFEKAAQILKVLLSIDPRSAMVMRLLSIALHLCGHDIEARHMLDVVVSFNPKDSQAYAYRCLMEAGRQIDDANESCQRAVELCEACSLGHLGLAINLLAAGRSKEAYVESSKAATISPEDAPVVLLKGDIEAIRGQTKLADKDYQKAMRLLVPPNK